MKHPDKAVRQRASKLGTWFAFSILACLAGGLVWAIWQS